MATINKTRPRLDITPAQLNTVIALLKVHLPNTTVWAYGSRVLFTTHPKSDLDLIAFTDGKQQPALSALQDAFIESNLPFSVDLLDWNNIPEHFKDNIIANHQILCEAGT